MPLNVTALTVFCILFAFVTVLGFFAARWQRGDLSALDEWGLGGRRFGVAVSWFLIGGDLFTAYTLIAVPATVYGTGAIGMFAVPYTILAFPIMFLIMPRLYNVSKRHALVTPADFVRARYGSNALALAVAVTGILATMPYIALQLVGMQVVIAAMGVRGSGLAGDAPLLAAFAILAAFTYTSGLRAPALIAFVKDTLIYIVVVAAVVAVPVRLGGFAHVFAVASAHFAAAPAGSSAAAGAVLLAPKSYWAYATLALGSALALFVYPHAITAILSSARADVLRRNAALLPLYSLLLGAIALLGYAALAAGVRVATPTLAIPELINALFPAWFAGFSFAAIAIGALVPAAVMSIAAANLWTRNVYVAYLRPRATGAQEANMAKLASLVVKVGALAFIVWVPTQYAIDLQLLGGIWILQTLPAIVLGLFGRWFHHVALLCGWASAMVAGSALAFSQGIKPTFALYIGHASFPAYIGIEALLLNLAVTGALTFAFDRFGLARGTDVTVEADYSAAPRERAA